VQEKFSDRLSRVRDRLDRAAALSRRPTEAITLVAVSKRHPIEAIREAMSLGLCEFGENYVQEAEEKLGKLTESERAATRWHLIGGLQSNKARRAAALFDCVQTVDRLSLAAALSRTAVALNKKISILVEVNLSEDSERSGVGESEALLLCEEIISLPQLQLSGLMGMAPLTESVEETRPYFVRLRGLFERLPSACRQTLSMGMSNDFEIAVAEGATLVRVGTALFGDRQY
jgi:PLP dependent protein